MRSVRYIAALVAIAMMTEVACAQETKAATVNVTTTVGWTLPTKATDGTDLTGDKALTGVELYESTSPIADDASLTPKATLSATAKSWTGTGSAVVGTTYYYRIKVRNKGGLSKFGPQGSKLIAIPIPKPAPATGTSVSMTVTVTAPTP